MMETVAAVTFVLICGNLAFLLLWRSEAKELREMTDARDRLQIVNKTLKDHCQAEGRRTVELEAEIQRIRAIPLTQKAHREENAVIKARSAADVRRITEAQWGNPMKEKDVN